MAVDETSRPLPRLADDTRRAYVATGWAVGVAVLLPMAYAVVTALRGREVPPAQVPAMIALLVFAVQFVLYQVLTWRVLARLRGPDLVTYARHRKPGRGRAGRRRRTAGTDQDWAASAALTALAAVLVIALVDPLRSSVVVVVLCVIDVVAGWVMVVFAYAVTYLRLDVESGGLDFPGTEQPVWRDYVYVSVQVSTTFATSDVTVTNTAMRGWVTSQTLIAFVFNTVIVALLVSVMLTVALQG